MLIGDFPIIVHSQLIGGFLVKTYDVVIQLGSQVQFFNGQYQLAPHTQMRMEAMANMLQYRIASCAVISGGSNFGVRYNDQELLKPSVFSFAAFANSSYYNRKSEAEVIKDFLVHNYGIDSSRIFAETMSSTTKENAEFVNIILRRRPMFTGKEKIGVLTQLYHMERALADFKDAGLDFEPIFAENVLAGHSSMNQDHYITKICEYYATPKGGKKYDVERIRQLLTEGKSLAELMSQNS